MKKNNYIPEPPLCRILREDAFFQFSSSKFCPHCHSTMSKDGFLGLFGEVLCHNEKCPNSKSKLDKNHLS